MPIVAEPQPTRIRSSRTPFTIGGWPDCTTSAAPLSTASSTASPLLSASSASQVARPCFLPPPVRWLTPPRESICEPYSPVITCPIGSPWARTRLRSGPTWRSVSNFTFTPQ